MNNQQKAKTDSILPTLPMLACLVVIFMLAACDRTADESTQPETEVQPEIEIQTMPTRSPDSPAVANPASAQDSASKARANMEPRSGSDVGGVVMFTQQTGSDSIEVTVRLAGLPAGKHGFHIHEVGDCSAADASSAGGHFNPEGTAHGAPASEQHHVGDLGNLEARENQTLETSLTFEHLSFTGEHSILGRAVVVHAGEDDLQSQPSGNAGARIACGVITGEPGGIVE